MTDLTKSNENKTSSKNTLETSGSAIRSAGGNITWQKAFCSCTNLPKRDFIRLFSSLTGYARGVLSQGEFRKFVGTSENVSINSLKSQTAKGGRPKKKTKKPSSEKKKNKTKSKAKPSKLKFSDLKIKDLIKKPKPNSKSNSKSKVAPKENKSQKTNSKNKAYGLIPGTFTETDFKNWSKKGSFYRTRLKEARKLIKGSNKDSLANSWAKLKHLYVRYALVFGKPKEGFEKQELGLPGYSQFGKDFFSKYGSYGR
jgi:hypothetical protein